VVGDLFANGNLEDTIYNIYFQKIQFLLGKCEMLEHLMASMSTRIDKDENDQDVIASKQHLESLKAYSKWVENGRPTCYTM